MVRTRATASEAHNPHRETGGVSHQNAAEMEARIAQMSRDMEALTQQNLRLLRQLASEQIPEMAEGDEEEESNAHEEGDRKSRRVTDRAQHEDRPQQAQRVANQHLGEGIANPPPGDGVVNPRDEERRHNEAIATLDEKYEDRYNRLQLEIQQNSKGKTSRVDSLLNKSSPFTERVMAVQLPEKFKAPTIQTYTGIEDPTEHLDNYKMHMDLQGTPQEMACQAFPLTLSGSARDWFRKLPPSSVTCFDDLGRKFVTQFLAGCKRKKPSGQLMVMRQKECESLKDYMVRFNQAKLKVDSPTEEMVYAALYQGLRVEGPLMSEIALNHPENLTALTDVIEKYVNQEETLAALRESQKQKVAESSNSRKKKKKKKKKKKRGLRKKKSGPKRKKPQSITSFP
jgi:hypothetical protein